MSDSGAIGQMLKLVIEETATDIWVIDKSFSMGSADDNLLVLDDATIGEHHARITLDGNKYILRDLGSPNGTFVNGQRINQRQIIDKDRLCLGDVKIQVIDPMVPGNQSQWCLVASSRWLSGQVYALEFSEKCKSLRIGRGKHCDIIFPETHLAREHITLTEHGDHLRVSVLDSVNGTYINDQPAQRGKLYPGSRLRLDVYGFQVYGPISTSPLTQALIVDKSLHKHQTENNAPPDIPLKRWKSRPTSPGNRSDQNSITSTQESSLVKLAAIIALLGFVALGLYVWLG